MSTSPRTFEDVLRAPRDGEPVYRVAETLPSQGRWTFEQFLRLNDDEGLIELIDGRLEFPPVTTEIHQVALEFLFELIKAFTRTQLEGRVHTAGIRVKMPWGDVRQPDVVFMFREHDHRRQNKYWDGADLVVEVVSEDDPNRDWIEKKAEYAAAGIPEYWIADPRDNTLTIFTLDDGAIKYRQAGRWGVGETAASVLLEGLTVEVGKVFERA